MLNLNGVLGITEMAEVQRYCKLRIRPDYKLETPEALALYEQNYLETEEIKELCEKTYGIKLSEPSKNFVPENLVALFRETKAVPVAYLPMQQEVWAVFLPELSFEANEDIEALGYQVKYYPTTIYYYLEQYQQLYGKHDMLYQLPCKLVFDTIVQEGIKLQAADITITTLGKSAEVYYNVRKRKVRSKRIFDAEFMRNTIIYLCAKSPYDFGSRVPKYVDVDLKSKDYRGRAVIVNSFKGFTITVRILPSAVYQNRLEDLNLSSQTIQWLRECMMDDEVGLRLIVGETMSGKNTTALALLHELVTSRELKVISVEMPVEQELQGVVQINTENQSEYKANIRSLIRQNPDFVYITEIQDENGLDTIEATNTGKRVLATLHANSVGDVFSRLMDITGMSLDRIIQTTHSIMFQKLVRDEEADKVYPKNRYLRFTDEMKYELYGKTLGDVLKLVHEKEAGDEILCKM